MARVKEIQDKEKAPKVDRGAAKRFVRSALWQQAQKKKKLGNDDEEGQESTSSILCSGSCCVVVVASVWLGVVDVTGEGVNDCGPRFPPNCSVTALLCVLRLCAAPVGCTLMMPLCVVFLSQVCVALVYCISVVWLMVFHSVLSSCLCVALVFCFPFPKLSLEPADGVLMPTLCFAVEAFLNFLCASEPCISYASFHSFCMLRASS